MKSADELFSLWLKTPAEKTAKKSGSKSVKKIPDAPAPAEPKNQVASLSEIFGLFDSVSDAPSVSVVKTPKTVKKVEGQNFMKSIEKIQKSAEKHGLSGERGTFSKGGNLYILDKFRILKSKYAFITAKENPKAFDAEGFFTKIHSSKSMKKLTAPSIPEMKKLIENAKAEYCKGLSDLEIRRAKRKGLLRRVLYQFENGITVNADYLIDAISVTGSTEFRYSDKKNPLIFQSDDGNYEMALCTVNSAENFQKKAKVA